MRLNFGQCAPRASHRYESGQPTALLTSTIRGTLTYHGRIIDYVLLLRDSAFLHLG